jgi:hypothetical protein
MSDSFELLLTPGSCILEDLWSLSSGSTARGPMVPRVWR